MAWMVSDYPEYEPEKVVQCYECHDDTSGELFFIDGAVLCEECFKAYLENDHPDLLDQYYYTLEEAADELEIDHKPAEQYLWEIQQWGL